MKKKLILAAVLAAAPVISHANIVLSEVLYDAPNNDSTEEYVELFNASCQSINLSSYQLQDNGATMSLSGIVAANSYFTVAKNSSAYQALFNQAPDANNLSLTLGNSGDYVRLLNNDTVIDTVAWENGLSGWTISTRNKSIHRTALTSAISSWSVSSNAGSHHSGELSIDCAPTTPSNVLENNTPRTGLTATRGNALDFTIDIPNSATALNVTIAANNGDADLIVSHNNQEVCKPYLDGSNEQCDITSPATGTYTVEVNAYRSFNNLSLTATYTTTSPVDPIEPPANTVLINKQPLQNIAIAKNDQRQYQFDVPAQATDLAIVISGGSGDADLYVQHNTPATTSSHICRPYLGGNEESCSFATPQSGRYHILLDAYAAVSGLTLEASYKTPAPVDPVDPVTPPTDYEYNVYYQSAIAANTQNLKSSLNAIIKDHVRFSYSQAWDGLGYADEDPDNSNNVILLYTGRSEPKTNRAGMSNSQDAWNREHVWAKSHGFPSSGQHAYTDFHHLRPADVSVNSARGNKDFLTGGSEIGEVPGTFTDSDSFEPADNVKGDVARMIFYMDVRYQGSDAVALRIYLLLMAQLAQESRN